MSTPITDAQIEELSADKYSDLDAYMAMTKHARLLELDRAALMEALAASAQFIEPVNPRVADGIRKVISTARANFP